jgi:hypothetical protein
MAGQSQCQEEIYFESKPKVESFFPLYDTQFKVEEQPDSCIRLYYLPSFQKEMLLETCKLRARVKFPDTGTIWGNVQIYSRNYQGEVVSGRVADVTDSIGSLDIVDTSLEDSLARSL